MLILWTNSDGRTKHLPFWFSQVNGYLDGENTEIPSSTHSSDVSNESTEAIEARMLELTASVAQQQQVGQELGTGPSHGSSH